MSLCLFFSSFLLRSGSFRKAIGLAAPPSPDQKNINTRGRTIAKGRSIAQTRTASPCLHISGFIERTAAAGGESRRDFLFWEAAALKQQVSRRWCRAVWTSGVKRLSGRIKKTKQNTLARISYFNYPLFAFKTSGGGVTDERGSRERSVTRYR